MSPTTRASAAQTRGGHRGRGEEGSKAVTSPWSSLEVTAAKATVAGALVWLAVNSHAASRHHYEQSDAFRQIIKPGWLPFSTGIDLTDIQWRQYRESAPLLIPSILGCVWLRERIAPNGDANDRRVLFTAIWSVVVAVVMHGTGSFWLFCAMTLNYHTAKFLRNSALAPVWAWAFSLTLAFSSKTWGEKYWEELLEGWGIVGKLLATQPSFKLLFGPAFAPLDSMYKGLYGWTRPLNLTMLRLISFNLDVRPARACKQGARTGPADAAKTHSGSEGQTGHAVGDVTHGVDGPSKCPFAGNKAGGMGASGHGALADGVPCSFWVYVCYILYPPLYISGPIISYEDFAAQLTTDADADKASRAAQREGAVRQLLRALGYGLLLEVVLHYIHFHAISHNLDRIFHKLPNGKFWLQPWEIMAVGFFMLNFIYIKFLVIWRIAGASAALDAIQTTDNMNRCVCNNYTFSGFWRSWHRSLHLWIVKYMYVPMGGNKRRALIAWPIFVFVGLWHDLEIRWVAWASLNCFCLFIEGLVLHVTRKSSSLAVCRVAWWWRYVSVAGSVVNIYLLMLSNLAILYGFQGSWDFFKAFTAPPPPATASEVLLCNAVGAWWLVCGVFLMHDIREREYLAGKLKRF